MDLDLAGINWLGVIIATVVYFGLGALWFAPQSPIGRAWVASSGYTSPGSGAMSTDLFYIVPAAEFNKPQPWTWGVINASYHAVGLLLAAIILSALR